MSCNPEMMSYLKKIYFLYGKEIPKEQNIVFSYNPYDNPYYMDLVAIPNPEGRGIVYRARNVGYLEFIETHDHEDSSRGRNVRQYIFTEKFIKEIMSGNPQSH